MIWSSLGRYLGNSPQNPYIYSQQWNFNYILFDSLKHKMNEFIDFSIQDELDYFEDSYENDHILDANMISWGTF